MLDKIRVATRYAPKAANADITHNEEHLQIIEELLSMKDTQLTDDERDSSTEFGNFDFTL